MFSTLSTSLFTYISPTRATIRVIPTKPEKTRAFRGFHANYQIALCSHCFSFSLITNPTILRLQIEFAKWYIQIEKGVTTTIILQNISTTAPGSPPPQSSSITAPGSRSSSSWSWARRGAQGCSRTSTRASPAKKRDFWGENQFHRKAGKSWQTFARHRSWVSSSQAPKSSGLTCSRPWWWWW